MSNLLETHEDRENQEATRPSINSNMEIQFDEPRKTEAGTLNNSQQGETIQNFLEELTMRKVHQSPTHCPEHPDEQLQFYCYNLNQVLCAECLVTGKFTGLEISNLKKATDRLKGKFEGLVKDTESKLKVWSHVQKEISENGEELSCMLANQEDIVKSEMNRLRQLIDAKEKELLEGIVKAGSGGRREIEDILNWVLKERNKMENTIAVTEQVKNLDELELCNFYLKQSPLVETYLNYEVGFKVQETESLLKDWKLELNNNAVLLQEDCKKIGERINLMIILKKSSKKMKPLAVPHSSSIKRKTKPLSVSSLHQPETEASPLEPQEPATEIQLLQGMQGPEPSQPATTTKPSYLKEAVYGESNLNHIGELASNESTAELFEKNITKILEIRRRTPAKERTPITLDKISLDRSASRDEARAGSLSSFKIDVKRKISEKKVGLLGQERETIKENPVDPFEFSSKSILKSFLLTTSPKPSFFASPEVDLTEGTRSTKGMHMRSPSDSGKIGQGLYGRNTMDNGSTSRLNHYSVKNLLRGNEIFSVLGVEKDYSKLRDTKPSSTTMKKKLNTLSSALFN